MKERQRKSKEATALLLNHELPKIRGEEKEATQSCTNYSTTHRLPLTTSSSISCFFLILINNTTMSYIPTISITFSSCKLKSHTTVSAPTTSRQPRSQLQQKIGEPSAHGPTRSSNLYPISTVRLHASACHTWIVSWQHPLPWPRLH